MNEALDFYLDRGPVEDKPKDVLADEATAEEDENDPVNER